MEGQARYDKRNPYSFTRLSGDVQFEIQIVFRVIYDNVTDFDLKISIQGKIP